MVGGIDFLKLDKEITFNVLDYYNYYEKDVTFYCIGIYSLPLGCDINMKFKNPWKTEEYIQKIIKPIKALSIHCLINSRL